MPKTRNRIRVNLSIEVFEDRLPIDAETPEAGALQYAGYWAHAMSKVDGYEVVNVVIESAEPLP